jgi:hypothetical protein
MNKLIIAGIGAGATVVGYAVGTIFGKKVNNKVKNTASNMGSKVKNTFKKKSSSEAPPAEAQTA